MPQSYFQFVRFFVEPILWPLSANVRLLVGNASMKVNNRRGSPKVICHVLESRFVAINSRSVNIFGENLCKLEFPSQIRTSRKFPLQRSNWILRRLLRDRDGGGFLRIFPQHPRPPLHVLQFPFSQDTFLCFLESFPSFITRKNEKIYFFPSFSSLAEIPRSFYLQASMIIFSENGVERSSFIKSVTALPSQTGESDNLRRCR